MREGLHTDITRGLSFQPATTVVILNRLRFRLFVDAFLREIVIDVAQIVPFRARYALDLFQKSFALCEIRVLGCIFDIVFESERVQKSTLGLATRSP